MNKVLRFYIIVLIILSIIFSFGVFIYPHSGLKPSGDSLERPSISHILGTDDLGIDIFAQISRGFFASMFIGICTAGISFIIGGVMGVLSGYAGGKVDFLISFFINLFLSIPQLPVMIVIGSFLGQSIFNVITIVALFSWASIAKVVRAKTIQIKDSDYVKLARSYGGGFIYIFKTHMLNDLLPILLINSLFVINRAIIQEASLAFLGLSDPMSKSWGLMIQKVTSFSGIYFTDYWTWWLIPPLICIVVIIFCIRMISREAEKIITL